MSGFAKNMLKPGALLPTGMRRGSPARLAGTSGVHPIRFPKTRRRGVLRNRPSGLLASRQQYSQKAGRRQEWRWSGGTLADMQHDPAEEEIFEMLRGPMGDVAKQVAWGWLQRYRAQALEAARRGTAQEEREGAVREVRAKLLETLRDTLPLVIDRETACDRAVSDAQELSRRIYRERFDREVSATLSDPSFERPTAERIAMAELHTFRRELEQELAELTSYHRRRLREAVTRLLE